MANVLRIDSRDNVAVALQTLEAGIALEWGVVVKERIPAKHKVALKHFSEGNIVTMYGVTVGVAMEKIEAGALLTTENIAHESGDFTADRWSGVLDWAKLDTSKWAGATFDGFHRSDSNVGTANYWIIVPLVFCENRNVQAMREALEENLGYRKTSHYSDLVRRLIQLRSSGANVDELMAVPLSEDGSGASRTFPSVDGVKFLTHGLGCGGTDDDADALCALLAGYITHPNVAGATVLSLGCQNSTVSRLEVEIAKRDSNFDRPLFIHTQQKAKSEKDMMSEALKRVFLGLEEADQLQREPAPLSKLVLGMECGGSDGFSGISANPVLGRVSDLVVSVDGRSILSEFPELCGVEQGLIERCIDRETGERLESLIRRYATHAAAVGAGFHMNPSPGNIADGLITDAMKSGGAAKKGGTSPIVAALDYTEPVVKSGLNLLCTPGGDVESTTAMVGSGANVLLFSTGLGTPTGNAICPTLKISSNSELAGRMNDLIDFDTGAIIEGSSSVSELGEDLFDRVIATASGRYTPRAVALGQDDFLPWKRGVSL